MRRRQLLQLGAASLLAAPFVRLLSRATASPTSRGRRLLVFFSPNGTVPHRWTPSGSGASYQFREGSILAPLAGMESELLVLGGMDFNTGDNHEGGMTNMLTCGGDISFDQVIADHLGDDARFRSLELSALTSAWGGSAQTRMAYRDGAFITPDDDPAHAWRRLFGQAEDPVPPARRKSVIDLAATELQQLQRRLGREEQLRLDAHLDGLRTMERGLFGDASCDSPIAPALADPQNNDRFPGVVAAQIDLAVQALACGATPVVTLQLSHTVSPVVFTWLGESQGHHDLSHSDDGNTAGVDSFVRCEQWYAEQFRTLIDKLGATLDAETGGSLLDSTVVMWVKELGDSRLHVTRGVPLILAGAGVQTGRFVDLGGATHDRVLTSVAQTLGLELPSFGIGTGGPLEVLA